MRQNDETGLPTAAATTSSTATAGWVTAAAAALAATCMVGLAVTPAQAQQAQRIGDQSPDYHEVVRGDTLWDLSGRYYGDHYQWPRMWSYNTQITNPHWIYPGDIVYLREQQQPEESGVEPAAHHQEVDDPDVERRALGGEDSAGLYLPLAGMIVPEEEQAVGRIVGSPKSARMLVEHDEVWVGFGDDAYLQEEEEELHDDDIEHIDDPGAVEEGDRFAIIRLDEQLKDGDGDTVGYKYFVLGSLDITTVPEQDGTAKTAMIQESWREIERGDLLVPYERQLQFVQPREAEDDLVAEIIDSVDPSFIFAPQEFVFVNRGAEDGVRPGNRFFAYQQWEGFETPQEDTAPEIPWQQVGQLMVLDVREQHSLAVVTRSERELFIGDRLEMYRGH